MGNFVEIKLTGLEGVSEMLRNLPAEINKRGGPAKKALRKGAVVIRKAEITNLKAVTFINGLLGSESTGLLAKNIIVSRGKPAMDGERYLVRIRRKTYPRNGGKAVTTLKTAQLLEYGSSQQPAEPWIRPAFQSKAEEAIRTVEKELLSEIDRITKQLMRAPQPVVKYRFDENGATFG